MTLRQWVDESLKNTEAGTTRWVIAQVVKAGVELTVSTAVAVVVLWVLIRFTSVRQVATLLGTGVQRDLIYVVGVLSVYGVTFRCQYPGIEAA
jgi:hypothetical protein